MGAHTPGPWRAGRSDMISQCGGCEVTYKNIYAEDVRGGFHKPTGTPMGVIVGRAVIDPVGAQHELPLTERELLANAQLMAAAPDLLTALRSAANSLEMFAEGDRSDEGRKRASQYAQIARAAIARASPNT